MNTFVDTVLPKFSGKFYSRYVLGELRSDHAGETGAVFIYKGVLAISGNTIARSFAKDHLVTEIRHLEFFEQWLPKNQHSKLLFLWKLSGFFLGAASALMGNKILFLTISAVETFVLKHYAQQISYLQSQGNTLEKNLLPILVKFKTEEQHHLEDANSRLREAGPFAKLWCAFIGFGSKLAVIVAKRV